MNKAYSYLRFSHPDQAKGDSLRRQLEGTRAFCARHGLTLDESVTLQDKGISGYTGEHRKNPDRHALALFLQLADQGRVPADSYLVIENLDRLSREHIRPALSLFLSILDKKINIVQVSPETVFRHDADAFDLMRAIMELSRGHSESAMKSVRVGKAWAQKRTRAGQEKLTARVPGWLKATKGDTGRVVFEELPDAVATVRRIYRMALEGHGMGVIVSRLNREGVAPIGRATYWARSYVAKILSNRAVLGEYQPHSGRGAKRTPVGDPVATYYPAIIDERTYWKVQAALRSRKKQTGPQSGRVKNLFTGLLHDARGKGSLVLRGVGDKAGVTEKSPPDTLVSYKAHQGVGTFISFPYRAFETAVLATLREVKPADLEPDNDGADEVAALSSRLATLDHSLRKLQAKLEAGVELDTVLAAVERMELNRKELRTQLAAAQERSSSREATTLGEIKSLLTLSDPERRLLRAKVRQVVSEVWAVFFRDGATRFAVIQLFFRAGLVRSIIVRCSPRRAGGVVAKDEELQFLAHKCDVREGHDLRKGFGWVEEPLEGLFPSLSAIAATCRESGKTPASQVKLWTKATGKGLSEFYRRLRAKPQRRFV